MRDAATEAQVRAAAPDSSTWLAANAGSGKTRVLTDRVARLLLEGTDPAHILCLTYTKAAATEMQNRLFKRLGAWAMAEEAQLQAELAELGAEGHLDAAALQEARTLFARAIETPGGLRIQTIHSFCAALLRRFPLEARVSPQFQEMEERAGDLLRAELLDRFADGPERPLLEALAPFLISDDLSGLLREITGHRAAFDPPPDEKRLRAAYGLGPLDDADSLRARVFQGGETELIAQLTPLLRDSGKTDQKAALALAGFSAPDAAGLELLCEVCLTQAGTPRKTFPAKKVRTAAPELCADLDALSARLGDWVDANRALNALRRDMALCGFAAAFVQAYETEKLLRGWLDFDDLITRARDLLSDPQVADWVLYRLDGGIDHILVDEAQDTSPVQWQVIERLAHEFTSGRGARDIRRTIFVVGDKKQSIYSFQGADPSEFDRMREEFRARLAETEAPLTGSELAYSFRSAEPILRLVDNSFRDAAASGFDGADHIAFHEAMPGRVDLWPVVEPVGETEDGAWHAPVDRAGERHHTVILARRIAQFVARLIAEETPLPVQRDGVWQARPVTAGDVLILVRSRSRLFKEIIRACKAAGLPIAGADRLKVMAELAVRDVVALLRFLETPEDDLSLACALRSPLFGLDEQALFDLAHRRTERHLWQALRARGAVFPGLLATLDDLRDTTDFLRPYDLIERILTRHHGRARLIGRLGPEAEDGLNALLQQALAYEQNAVPTLTGFLAWAEADNLEIKRAPDSAGETLRVMTVHGAKGLEAPIVILPDAAPSRKDNEVKSLLLSDHDGVMWKQTAEAQPARQRAAMETARARDAQERDRLLYVALTRAEKWLVVAAAGDLGKQGRSWYDTVRRGMVASGEVAQLFDFGTLGRGEGLRLENTGWSALPVTVPAPPPVADDAAPPPDTPLPAPELPVPPRSPSALGGAKALAGAAGDSEAVALARGTALHLLLEHLAALPDAMRHAAGGSLLRQLARDPETAEVAADGPALLDEVMRVLEAPALAPVFAPGTLAEVPFTADLPGLGRVSGVIDRLIVTPDRVTAVDFKSNRTVPRAASEVPEGLLRQMGAYRAALAQIYPGRAVETALVWTATAHYMPLPDESVTQALARAGTA